MMLHLAVMLHVAIVVVVKPKAANIRVAEMLLAELDDDANAAVNVYLAVMRNSRFVVAVMLHDHAKVHPGIPAKLMLAFLPN